MPGRYLWLKLLFQGDGATTPELESVGIEFPRVSLRRYLPAVFGAEPVSADFTDRWLAVFDREFRAIESTIDRQARLFDPLACPADPSSKRDFLSWLAGWVGVVLERNWPERRRRAYLKNAPRLFPWRGTLEGLRKSLYLFLGLDHYADFVPQRADCVPCVVPSHTGWRPPRLLLEHFHLRRWMMLGHAKLSDNAKLWGERIVNRSRLGGPGEFRVPDAPSGAQLGLTQLKKTQDPCRDPFHVYAHKLSVFVPAACVRDPSLARALKRLVDLERPAHAEAQVIPVEPRFRVGVQAMLGLDAVIGWRAVPLEVDEAALGRATVLTGAVDPRPRFRVGNARIGEKTTLP
jgi:phage tail-like protein